MKLAKETNKNELAEPKPALNTLLLAGLMASSFLVGCNSMGQKADNSAEAIVEKQTETKKSTASVEAQKKSDKNQAEATALMATLSAPIQEPGLVKNQVTKKPVAQKAITEKLVVQKPKVVESKPVAPVKVAEVKKAVAAKVEVKSVEKPVAKAAPKPVIKKVIATSKQSGANKTLNAKPLNISLKDLPVTYDIWQFKQGVAALEKGVVVSTPTWEMGKESYNSQIWVTLMENQILINSSSDIDTSAGNLGVIINDGALIPFTRIEANNIGVIEGQWLAQLEDGGKMDIFLAFFPGKVPQSDVFKTDVSLDSLPRVVPTYRNLLK